MNRIVIIPLIIIILLPMTVVGLMKGFNLRIFYPYQFSGTAINEEKVVRSLGKFSVGDDYQYRVAVSAERGENRLAAYVNEETHQKLLISILREHSNDDLGKIKVLDRIKVENGLRQTAYENRWIPSFSLTYLVPLLLRKDDLSGMGSEAIIKGIHVKAQERFETAFAEVFYVKGTFSRIGLFKEPNGRWNHPAPVFDFKVLHEGAIALIKSKGSGKVVIAVSVNGLEQFQEKEFREFIESVRPDWAIDLSPRRFSSRLNSIIRLVPERRSDA
jgi:hypothetical protein